MRPSRLQEGCTKFTLKSDPHVPPAGRRNSHSEHEALRELKNELMAQWDGIRGATPGGPRIMVRAFVSGFQV